MSRLRKWAREAASSIRTWREERQLRNKKTYSEYAIRPPAWRTDNHGDLPDVNYSNAVPTSLSSLPHEDVADLDRRPHRYGTPVVAPYPVDLHRLASEAHSAHERAVEHDECEDIDRPVEESHELADDASIASWQSLEGGPSTLPPKPQSRRNKRRAQKRQEERGYGSDGCGGRVRSGRGTDAASTSEKGVARKRAGEAQPIDVDYNLGGSDVPYSPACFTAKPRRERPADKQRLGLDDVLPRMKLVEWNGRSTHPLVDSEGRFLGLLLGEMRDEEYAYIRANVTHHLHQARRYCNFLGSERHRRGEYSTAQDGISIGGGQPHPMNMAHRTPRERRAVERLRRSLSVRRVANFGSSGLRTYVPEIYNEYARTLDQICDEDPTLRRPFANNVFAGITFNLGPRVVTARHRDHLNLPFAWCCVTVFGEFDYTLGGHLVLWDLGLVIEIPPGATFLIPSAILEHSNLDIAEGETRMSVTQYSAGGLFRWIRCGSRTQAAFERDGNRVESGSTRWEAGIALLGKWAGRLRGRRP